MTKNRLTSWIVCAAAVLATIGALEIVLGIRTGTMDAGKFVRPDSVFGRIGNADVSIRHRSSVGEYDTVLKTNSLGFRDVEHAYSKTPGRRRVLVVGDSFAAGIEVGFEDTFPRRLQAHFEGAGFDTEVVTTAMQTWSPLNHFVVYEHIGRRFDPDVVVMTMCFNDVSEDHIQAAIATFDSLGWPVRIAPMARLVAEERRLRRVATRAGRGGVRSWLGAHSVLLRFVVDRVRAARARRRIGEYAKRMMARAGTGDVDYDYFSVFAPDRTEEQRRAWDETFRVLEELNRRIRATGARFLVMVVPTGNQINAYEWRRGKQRWGFAPDSTLRSTVMQARIASYAARAGIPVLDLLPSLKHRSSREAPLYFDFDGHWTAAGHAAVADTLFSDLRRRGWLVD